MSITSAEYAVSLQGYAIVDCVVRSRRILYFVAREQRFDADPALADHAATKRVVVCIRDRPEGRRFSHGQLAGMATLFGGSSERPASQFVGVDADGDVYVLGSGQSGMEARMPGGSAGPRRGAVTRVRLIDGLAYVASSKRGLARRLGPADWESLSPPIDPMPRDAEEAYRMSRDWGFDDVDGFSADELYAVGGLADLWRIGGGSFRRIPLAFPLRPTAVCCGGDGRVYVGGRSGMLVGGRGDDWQMLVPDGVGMDFRDLVWHDGALYGGNARGLWRLQDGRMQAVALPAGAGDCCGHLSAHDGVLLMAGAGGALLLEDGAWQWLVRAEDFADLPAAPPVSAPAWRELRPGPPPAPAARSAAFGWVAALEDYCGRFEHKRRSLGRRAPGWQREQLGRLFGVRRWATESAQALARLEGALGVSVPPILRELWTGHGGFALFDADCGDSLQVLPVERLLRGPVSGWPCLYEFLCEYGSRREFERMLAPAEAAILREHYWAFGVVRHDDSDVDLLAFDRDGRIGRVHYRHDWAHFDAEAWRAEYAPLLRGALRVIDLDAELQARIRACRDRLEHWTPA